MWLLACWFLGLCVSAAALQPALVIVDPFTPYLSGHCREYCAEHGIELIETVSPYTANVLASTGRAIPESLQAPVEGAEHEWAEAKELLNADRPVLVLSESDAGVPTAELIQQAIVGKSSASVSARGCNGICHHLRNKFDQNERAAARGLPIVRQRLAASWAEAEEFLVDDLWAGVDAAHRKCIIKPCRGVASDGVHLCSSLADARAKFSSLLGSPKYGSVGEQQEAVLVQEFAEGTEYAVDTVTSDGETKVVALWRYEKFEANGAPFVYQCSELVGDTASEESRAVMDYTVSVLEAQGLVFGPTHTEVKMTPRGPRLMEVNARWHAQHFRPITQACLGTDALEITMDAFFRPERFAALPPRPAPFAGRGIIVHLVSFQQGTVAAVRHADTISDLRSCLHLSVDYEPGMRLVKTVDIRTDCGYVLLAHKDAQVVAADYDFICSRLQRELFELEPEPDEAGAAGQAGEAKRAAPAESQGSEEGPSSAKRPDSQPEAHGGEGEGEGGGEGGGGVGEGDEEGGGGEGEEAQGGERRARGAFARRRRERSARLRARTTATMPSQQQQPEPPLSQPQPRFHFQPMQVQRSREAEGEVATQSTWGRLGQRVLARIQRTMLGSALLLGLGYVTSLVAVLLLPSIE